MTVFTVDPRQKKIVDIYGRPIGLPINDFGSRSEIEFTGFTYSSSLSIALYLIKPDYRDGQTMPVYYGTAWTESNGVYKHEMKYGKDYYNSVTQNDSLARLVLVADSVVVLDQVVQIDMIFSYSEDAERLPVGPDGYATEAYVDAAVSGKADKSELEAYQEKITSDAKLDYALLSGTPTIPLSTSQLINDSTFQTSADVNAAVSGKLDNPSGGTAGQILTKTANGEEWADIEIPEETNPAFIQLEGKSTASSGAFVVDFAGKQIQKYGLESTADGTITFSVENSGVGVSGCAPTIEVQIPISGDTTVTFPEDVQVIDFPESLTGEFSNTRIAKAVTYHDIVFRNEQNFNGKWKTYANYAYKFDEADEYDYFYIEALEDDSTLSCYGWDAKYNLSASFDKLTWTALTSNVIATGVNTGTKVYLIGNTTTLDCGFPSTRGCSPTSDKKFGIGGKIFSLFSDWLEPKELTNTGDLASWYRNDKNIIRCACDFAKVTNFYGMFSLCDLSSFTGYNVDDAVGNVGSMLYGTKVTTLPIGFSMPNVTRSGGMFNNGKLIEIPDGFNMPNITNASQWEGTGQWMFSSCPITKIGNNVRIACNENATWDATSLTQSAITTIGDNFEYFTYATFSGTWDPAKGIKNVFPNATALGSWKVYNHSSDE